MMEMDEFRTSQNFQKNLIFSTLNIELWNS